MDKKPQLKQVTFMFPLEVLETMRLIAKEHQRSLVGEIVWALRRYIAQHQKEK